MENKKEYILNRWYPTLPNDWKTEHDYVYCKEESLMVNKLLMTTHIINFKHLEYRDFWEEVKQPLVVTEDGTNLEMPIDKVTIDNLDIALRMVGIYLDRHLIDKIIDLVELIENKGDNTSIKDVVALQAEWKEEHNLSEFEGI